MGISAFVETGYREPNQGHHLALVPRQMVRSYPLIREIGSLPKVGVEPTGEPTWCG